MSRHRGFGGAVAWLLVAMTLLGAAFVFPRWLGEQRARSTNLSQSQMHEWGTTGRDIEFENVTQRLVIVPPIAENSREIAARYLARLLGSPASCSVVATFDPRTGHIEIVGYPERFEARLPGGYKPHFMRALRHEYGHAAFYEWAVEKGMLASSDPLLALADPDSEPRPNDYPAELRPALSEWSSQPSRLYGHPYLTSTFVEYIAESYARMIEGHEVPAKTAEFLVDQYEGRRLED